MTRIIVFQGQLFGSPVPSELQLPCLKLAERAATQMLGLEFYDAEDGTLMFAYATPFPDLTLGGDQFIQALAGALQRNVTP